MNWLRKIFRRKAKKEQVIVEYYERFDDDGTCNFGAQVLDVHYSADMSPYVFYTHPTRKRKFMLYLTREAGGEEKHHVYDNVFYTWEWLYQKPYENKAKLYTIQGDKRVQK